LVLALRFEVKYAIFEKNLKQLAVSFADHQLGNSYSSQELSVVNEIAWEREYAQPNIN